MLNLTQAPTRAQAQAPGKGHDHGPHQVEVVCRRIRNPWLCSELLGSLGYIRACL